MPLQAAALSPDSVRALAQHARFVQDSLKLAGLSAHIDSQYVSYLEKTNAQVSVWWTAAGVLLAGIGVVVAFATVIAGLLMYRQSKEYKEGLADALGKYQAVLDGFIAEKRAELALAVKGLKEQMETATDERKKAIQAKIDALSDQSARLLRPVPNVASLPVAARIVVMADPGDDPSGVAFHHFQCQCGNTLLPRIGDTLCRCGECGAVNRIVVPTRDFPGGDV